MLPDDGPLLLPLGIQQNVPKGTQNIHHHLDRHCPGDTSTGLYLPIPVIMRHGVTKPFTLKNFSLLESSNKDIFPLSMDPPKKDQASVIC